jgi:RNA polymerase sigma-70 factor (ECF subfamily)
LKDLSVTAEDETSLIESYRPRLLYFALRRLRDRAMAEEIAQDTLTVMLQALRDNRIEDPARMPGFIFGVAKNLVSKALRQRLLQANPDSSPEPVHPGPWLDDPDVALLLEEQRQQVREALSQLSPNDRDILQRAFIAEQSLEEIATDMGIPNVAVRKRKSRALERLKKIFQERSQKR